MSPSLLRVAPLVLGVAAAPLSAQHARETRAQVDSATVHIGYDPLSARDDREIDRRLTARGGWVLGDERGAVLSLSHPVRFGTTIVPPGRHLLRLHRDRNGTWLVLHPVNDRGAPIRDADARRIPLEAEHRDSAGADLDIRLDAVRGTAETIIFSYDTTSRRTDRDVYRMETEANRGLTQLVISWGQWRWGVPLTAAAARPSP